MTKLLLSIHNRKDVVTAVESGADILDIAADDGQGLSCLEKVSHTLDNKLQLSLTVALPFIDLHPGHPSLACVDFLRVKTEKNGQEPDWTTLKQFARKLKTILLINTDKADPADWQPLLQQAKAAGLYGVMLESCSGNSQRLTRQYAMADIGKFVEDARQTGLVSGLAGALEAPDIPRLLPYHPDILGFCVAYMAGPGRVGLKKNRQLIRSLVPADQDIAGDEVTAVLGTDRILVSDFILPIHIGAYNHEHKRKQKVCFNVAVDVARISINPEDMCHIFSYDLILDGIRNLVSLGHIDLVETLAERIAAFILGYPRVQRVMVRVEKLDLGPKAVGIEIVRTKTTGRYTA